MAKSIKQTRSSASANPRSRASKRATSPSINTDKSIKEAPRASDATPVLAARPYGGVTKAKKKQKPMKRGQRLRQEKGLARAEAVQDQLEKKVTGANSRLKAMRERKVLWDEVNEATKEEQRKAPKFAVLNVEATQQENDEWEDEQPNGMGVDDAEMKQVDGVMVPAFAPATKLVVADRTASIASDAEDEADKIT